MHQPYKRPEKVRSQFSKVCTCKIKGNEMRREPEKVPPEHASIKKASTGIQGLDQITEGGLPAGRPTLVCGGAGAGKTMLATEFLVRGATEFNEPGVYVM